MLNDCTGEDAEDGASWLQCTMDDTMGDVNVNQTTPPYPLRRPGGRNTKSYWRNTVGGFWKGQWVNGQVCCNSSTHTIT